VAGTRANDIGRTVEKVVASSKAVVNAATEKLRTACVSGSGYFIFTFLDKTGFSGILNLSMLRPPILIDYRSSHLTSPGKSLERGNESLAGAIDEAFYDVLP
jgi:hypothetical protein